MKETASQINWLAPQEWKRDRDVPCLALGEQGTFDDSHIHAPCVAHENDTYFMWYAGSRGSVAGRIFSMGLATSKDGVHFTRHPASPVLRFKNNAQSVMTPAILRNPDGSLLREKDLIRLWFSSTDFPDGGKHHSIHETASADGLTWQEPSGEEIPNGFAPTVIKEAKAYRMWYTDVEKDPWCFRLAESTDGTRWNVREKPVVVLDQAWEHQRLFYPTVLKAGKLYLMWYGSYAHNKGEEMKTALGFAISEDGISWRKNPHNPVFRPDPSHDWESHFTTCQSVLRLPDGS